MPLMPQYKLTFFGLRGVGETIRCLFVYGSIPFEDVRVKWTDWPKLKQELEWGQLPILEIDGQVLSQSAAIMIYLAKKVGVMPSDDLQAARCDELFGALWDFFNAEWKTYSVTEDNIEKQKIKQAIIEKHLPEFLSKITTHMKRLGNKKWLINDNQISWVDFFYANSFEVFEELLTSNALDNFPELKTLKDSFYEIPQIKKWVKERPADEKMEEEETLSLKQ